MAKRFTDSEKFRDPWYRKLSTKMKLAWEYMLCECNIAGIWKFDLEMLCFAIGCKITLNEFNKVFSNRIHFINDEKVFIPKFVKFQYGNSLESQQKAVVKVRKILEENKLLNLLNSNTLSIPYRYPIDTVMDTDTDTKTDTDTRFDTILSHWNEQKIIKHKPDKNKTEEAKEEYKKKLKSWTHDELMEAITNYGKVINLADGYFKFKWSLALFLKRKGAEQFYPGNFVLDNYRKNGNKGNNTPKDYNKIIEQQDKLFKELR